MCGVRGEPGVPEVCVVCTVVGVGALVAAVAEDICSLLAFAFYFRPSCFADAVALAVILQRLHSKMNTRSRPTLKPAAHPALPPAAHPKNLRQI